jgi:hypothetical protein
LKLYDLEYGYDSIVNRQLLLSETRRHYLLHKEGDSIGYDFDTYKRHFRTKVPMDSVYKLEWLFDIDPSIFTRNPLTLQKQEKKAKGAFTEQYSYREKMIVQ